MSAPCREDPAVPDRREWLPYARKLDWTPSYVDEHELYPEVTSGRPWLPAEAWREWDEPFKTSYREYVTGQDRKEQSVRSVFESICRPESMDDVPPEWSSVLKLHGALLPLAEFAAVIGNLRAARFGRDGAWRTMALFGALDELRHAQIPLYINHSYLARDRQFDWTHRFYHTNNWVAIAARHFMDELLRASDPIEFAVATNFVFETGFTNLQFVALAAVAGDSRDHMLKEMLTSIQTDEARHSQIGPAVLDILVKHDRAYVQRLVDKWFWRSWRLFAVATGISMDYLTPIDHRETSFKEFMREWIIDQYLPSLEGYGLERPWYWDTFEKELDYYHHMVYASAYSYRSSVWFPMPMPGPRESQWLLLKYPSSWPAFQPVWERVYDRWRDTPDGLDLSVHGTSIIGFCHLCQIVLCSGTPEHNDAVVTTIDGQPRVFCSEPCRWIFEQEAERYASHKDLVMRVLAGQAPANLIDMLQNYMGLSYEEWGKDSQGGSYPWLHKRVPGGGA